ncbi:hypothetical protein R7D97_16690 [Vibrio sp. Vb5031]|uniref:DUF6884 domain-containing protein n=1 Tax=Vibrio hepatarius TaxID=171383 RepID=A0A0M0HXV6_9VIBR|nr:MULTISPECIES: DUF6884 domain-containing protein [Vibrio]KOO06905.1 hypothetical protein AKJ31_14465 [Vibrio hepatarius]MCA2422249.1 hypothetical protein [Vibrio alginolyticus]MCA2446888.1 hypothetical protein [Vibrio alginolyticus]MCR9821637.1 hypothetical protein [Vibrio parahaemolyticus]MDF5109129.1 hypothetical protein [Vibrio parahaemolyticus]
MSKYEVYIVSASVEQDWSEKAIEAHSLYTSPMFCACKTYVEKKGSPWLILSDMHGVVWPDTMLAPYDSAQLSDQEKSHRIERAFDPDALASTLIVTLQIQPERGLAMSQWKKNILSQTKFILLGESDSLGLAVTELGLIGSQVEFSHKGIPA